MDVNDTMDKHWALRMLRLQLTVPAKEGDRYGGEESGAQGGGTQGRTQEGTQGRTQGTNSTAAHALFVLASHAEDGRLGVADVVEFCLGPLLVSPVCFGGLFRRFRWLCCSTVVLHHCGGTVVLYQCGLVSLLYCITVVLHHVWLMLVVASLCFPRHCTFRLGRSLPPVTAAARPHSEAANSEAANTGGNTTARKKRRTPTFRQSPKKENGPVNTSTTGKSWWRCRWRSILPLLAMPGLPMLFPLPPTKNVLPRTR